MSVLSPKTLEEHREYLYEIVKLKLFFVHLWLEQHPEETFQSVIRNRVDIYRKTEANPGPHTPDAVYFDLPAWKGMEDKAFECYVRNIKDRSAFETEAFEIFKPSIDLRCERDYLDNSVLAKYKCGSLKHDPQPDATDPTAINFHIANAIRPHSIFENPDYLRSCFLLLCQAVKTQWGIKTLYCGSWLNSYPKWLNYFPQEWIDNMSAPTENVGWHYGFWGQFITAKGTFNYKYGKILRETGRFPYYPRISHCSVEALESFTWKALHWQL